MSKYFQYIVSDAITKLCHAYSETLDASRTADKDVVQQLAKEIGRVTVAHDGWDEYISALNAVIDEKIKTSTEHSPLTIASTYAKSLIMQLRKEFSGPLLSQLKDADAGKFIAEGSHRSPTYYEFIHLIMSYRIPKLINELVEGKPLTNNHGRKWEVLKTAAKDWHDLEAKGARLGAEELHRYIGSRLKTLKGDIQVIQDEGDRRTDIREHRQKDVGSYLAKAASRSTYTGWFNSGRTLLSKATGGMVADGKGELLRLLEPFVEKFEEAKAHEVASFSM